MKWTNIPLKTKLVLYVLVGVILVLAASTGVIISTVTSQQESLAYQQSIEMASNYANQFDSDFRSNKVIVETLSDSLENYNSNNRKEINNILEELLLENPDLVGVYVGYESNAFDSRDSEFADIDEAHDSTGRFVPYWNRIGGAEFVEPLVGYDTWDYYQLPKKKQQYVLTEPYLYQGILIVSHVSPIMKDGEFIGISGLDVSLEYVDEAMGEVKAFETGYAIVVSNSGILLSHPDEKGWIGKMTLDDFGVKEISYMSDEIRDGQHGYIETLDPTTGKEVIMFYEPIKTGNFGFVLTVPKEEMLAGVTTLRDRLIFISGISLLFMGCVAYAVGRSFGKPIDKIVDDFKQISDKALSGNLDARANTNVDVDFKEIPHGLNDILDVLNRVTNSHRDAEDSLLKYANELEKSNKLMEQMEAVINSSPVIVFLWKSLDGWPVEIVSENITQFGYAAEDFISGKIPYANIMFPEDVKRIRSEVHMYCEGGYDRFNLEYRIITKFGDVRWVESKNLIQRDEDSVVTHYQGIVLDITERKRAEKLSRVNEELKSMDRMKDLFTDIMRHDLLNPAGVIKGFTEVLLEMEEDARKIRALQTIERNNKKLIDMIEFSAKLAKLENIEQLEFQRVDIGSILYEVAEIFSPQLEKKDISLDLLLDGEYPARANPIIEEVFSNLLSNAIKYSPEGNSIIIDVLDAADHWKVGVADFGGGIADGDKPFIFERFKRAEKGGIKGSGIGLAIVKRIVELHDGDVGVEDNPRGQGSVFWVTIKKDI